jgi:Protein of unknown function (DUF3052)
VVAGYSGTPLTKKLGIKVGSRVFAHGAPSNYKKLLAPLPDGVTMVARMSAETDIAHLFATRRADLAREIKVVLGKMPHDGVIWVSWPKKSSKVPTDVTEDTIREVALPLGLVDIKVCAVDEVWSGLKLVIRRENRKS